MQVVIPYKPGDLGECYNEYMSKAEDWVLFLDHDVLLLNPHWYKICMNVINQWGHNAGFITCVTNRIGCRWQKAGSDIQNDDIKYHLNFAKNLYLEHGNDSNEILQNSSPLSGFFILTHKEAWEKSGRFKSGFLTVDNDYDNKIQTAGYKRVIIPGLYCYHMYTIKGLFNG